MNKNYKIVVTAVIIAVAVIGGSIYLYSEYLNPEIAFLRSGGTPFWTVLQNDTREITIQQGETKTIPVELHYWNGLRTLLGVKLEEPDTEHGGLYNPPDGFNISFNLDDGYVQVDNGKITDIISHRNVTLKEPSRIEQRFEGANMLVAEVGSITISASGDVPAGDYVFGLATTDARVNSPYGGNSQLLAIKVIQGDTGETAATVKSGIYPLSIGNRTYDITYNFASSEGAMKSIRTHDSAAVITIDVDSVDGTDLEITLPRKFLEQLERESGYHYCVGNEFVTFVREMPVETDQRHLDDMSQILTIPLAAGSSVMEIVGIDLLQSPPNCLHVGLEHYSFAKDLPGVQADTWNDAVVIARDYLDRLAQSNGEEEGAVRSGPVGSVELVYVHDNGTAFIVNRYDGSLEDVYQHFNYTPRDSYYWIVTLNWAQEREKPEYVFTIDAQTGEVKDLVAAG